MDRMHELVEKLNDLAYRYYVLDDPLVSDKEYDVLYDELKQLENKENCVLDNSPTKRVGGELLKAFTTNKHIQRLYSLDKCQSKEELVEYLEKIKKQFNDVTFTLELKYDGLTLNLTYEDKKLIKATTRGNGIEGEFVLEQARTIKTIPLSINEPGIIEIQGEVIMRLSSLKKYNKTHDEPLKNARNAAAGAVRNLDPKITKERNLDMIAYNIGYSQDINFESQIHMHDFLVKNKFYTGDYFYTTNDINDLLSHIDEIEKMRDKLDYLIDGTVIKVNDPIYREKLGYTEKFPKWAIAFKFKAEEVTTILKDVKWQVSRTGKVNPVAVLEPVDIAGATVQRATLSNISEIERKKLKLNSRVFVRRSNDVIPEILGVAEYLDNRKEIVAPKLCPYCGKPIMRDGVFLRCSNVKECAPAVIARLVHYASKDAMDIEGLSDKTCEQLYNELNVEYISDLYELNESDLENLEGFKDKKVTNLINAINNSKSRELSSFIYAIGIPNIGKKAARELANFYKNMDNFLLATYDEIISLPDFGEVMANDTIAYLKNPSHVDEIHRLHELGLIFKQEEKEGVFNGEKVVITGTLSTLKRQEAQKIVLDNGGDVADNISKNVTILVAGSNAGSKFEKAKKLNIKIISEAEFLKTVNK